MSLPYSSRILGTGSYLPPAVWKNDDLKKLMDTSDEWIHQRTGIRQRHWVDQDSEVSTSDLALEASRRAIQSAGIRKEDLDLIVFATLSPDHDFPGTGCFLQAKLGVPGIAVLDIRQQCTGFIYGISIADQFIKTGMYKNVLVVGAEIHSKGLDKTTRGRDLAVLFGDGAGAAVVGRSSGGDSESRVLSTHLHADGAYAKELWAPWPGNASSGDRLSVEKLQSGDCYPKMNGKSVFVHAVKRMPEVMTEALRANNLMPSDIDLFIFHQANLRIIEMVARQLEISESKVFNTIERYGNTTAATVPIGLDEAVKAGRLKPGMLVASAAFGSGFTWASMLVRW